ncbi:MAG: cache domain-containing protein, partial [Burkholderiales bacterium]
MRRITSRFVMLIATAAVAPLVIYGVVSIGKLDDGMKGSVEAGNLRVAQQVATQIKLYIDSNARVLRSVGEEIAGTRLAAWQQSRILKNHVLEFPEFREISLFDSSGRPVATSRVGAPVTSVPSGTERATQGVQVSAIFEDEDNLPATDLTVRLRSGSEDTGWLVARISLEEL